MSEFSSFFKKLFYCYLITVVCIFPHHSPQLQPKEFSSFLRLNIHCGIYTEIVLFIHPVMDTWVASMSWLLYAEMNIGVQIHL